MTDADVKLALSERDTLLLTMLGEARGEELEGRVAVACCIRNRAKDPDRWPDDIKGVCFERLQFSCWNTTDPNYRLLMKDALAMVSDYAIRSTLASDAIVNETRWIAEGILGGQVRDRTGGANHYMSRQLWESPNRPLWGRDKSPTAYVGRHIFLKL